MVLRRGCSSVSKVEVSPIHPRTSIGMISSAKRPSSMAATALRCEWKDHSSISSRVTPTLRAVFSPTVTIMFMLGASGVLGWLGDSHCSGIP